MKYGNVCALFLAFFGCAYVNLLGQETFDPWGSVAVVRVSEQDVGDGQEVVIDELRLGDRPVAWMETAPKSSNPLAPAPTPTRRQTIQWVVLSASFDAAGQISAVCELRDDERRLGLMAVFPSGVAIFTPLSPSVDQRYAVAVNTFRGRVRYNAIARVATGELDGHRVVVRVTFPETVVGEEDWDGGFPSIR